MAQQEEEEEDEETKYDATSPLMTGNSKGDINITNINPRKLYLQESAPSSDDGNQLHQSNVCVFRFCCTQYVRELANARF